MVFFMGSVLVNYNDPASEVLTESIKHKSLDANPASSSFRALREEHARREEEERRRREEEARFMAEQQRLQEEKEEQERARAEHEENLRLQRQVSSASWVTLMTDFKSNPNNVHCGLLYGQ